jgi:hypothetical protein
MLTRPPSAARPAASPVPDLRFSNLSPVYARVAAGDAVKKLIEREGGRLPGRFFAAPVVEETPLPLITVIGHGPTAEAARTTVVRGSRGFSQFVQAQQDALPKAERLTVAPLSTASPAVLIDPRKKTLPIFVFLAVLCAVVALIFIRDNLSPRESPERPRGAADDKTSTPEGARDVGRPKPLSRAPVPALPARHAPTLSTEPAPEEDGVEGLREVGRWAKRPAQ